MVNEWGEDMIITLDGLAGSGKSTLAKLLAAHLGFVYLNTGKMYRALTAYIVRQYPQCLSSFCAKEVSDLIQDLDCQIYMKEGELEFEIAGESWDQHLTIPSTIKWVSVVASWPQVRQMMQVWQKMAAEKAGSLVAEGRDMGSVVFPQAEKKFFIFARDESRAKRRYSELEQANALQGRTYEEILISLQNRDRLDSSREHSPLIIPQGAIEIDTSDLTVDELVQILLKHIKQI